MLYVQAETSEASAQYTLDEDITFIPENLIHIKADGQELVWIKAKFSTAFDITGTGAIFTVYSIPMAEAANQMYWKGDIAKTILMNLW